MDWGFCRILFRMLTRKKIFVDYFFIFVDFFSGKETAPRKFVTICLLPPKTSRRPWFSPQFFIWKNVSPSGIFSTIFQLEIFQLRFPVIIRTFHCLSFFSSSFRVKIFFPKFPIAIFFTCFPILTNYFLHQFSGYTFFSGWSFLFLSIFWTRIFKFSIFF